MLNGKYNLKYQYSSDFDYFYRMIVHNNLKGIATNKDELFGIFRLEAFRLHLIKKNIFFLKKIQIRFDNKQNKLFLYNIELFKNWVLKTF